MAPETPRQDQESTPKPLQEVDDLSMSAGIVENPLRVEVASTPELNKPKNLTPEEIKVKQNTLRAKIQKIGAIVALGIPYIHMAADFLNTTDKVQKAVETASTLGQSDLERYTTSAEAQILQLRNELESMKAQIDVNDRVKAGDDRERNDAIKVLAQQIGYDSKLIRDPTPEEQDRENQNQRQKIEMALSLLAAKE